MPETPRVMPIIVLGRSGAVRQQCIAHLGATETVCLVAVGATMRDIAVPDFVNVQRGVVVFGVDYPATNAAVERDIQAMRLAAPAWPILAVGHPPALLHPHIAGWLSLGSPIDLVAALRVVASGGWVCERVAELALLQTCEPVRAQVGRAA